MTSSLPPPQRKSVPPPRSSRPPPLPVTTFGPSEAAIFETFVVPRYLNLFADLLLEMVAGSEDAQVVHLLCRTGYPDRVMLGKLPGAHFYGVDPSPSSIELARAKAGATRGMVASYRASELPAPLTPGAFSHGYALHPLVVPEERRRLVSEFARLIAPRGQMLLAMPMRGSTLEIADLLREYALKHQANEVAKAVEAAVLLRPTPDELNEEVRSLGFDFVDVEVRPVTLSFKSGRGLIEDPVSRFMILPEYGIYLGADGMDQPFQYVQDAMDRYFSDTDISLTVNVGCVSGRRV